MIKIKIILLAFLFMVSIWGFSQNGDTIKGYHFTPVIELKSTPIEDQHRSGTCWSYASTSFLESEMLRMGKPEVNLSEMFVVWQTYSKKAEKYIRMHGSTNFGGGGAFHDVTWVMKNFGMVPEEAFSGLVIDEEKAVHGEMDEVLKAYLDAVIKNQNRKLTPVWHNAFDDILNNYLGEIPESFKYKGKSYNPKTFVSDYMGLNADNYIEIGSFTHHPFYEKFIIEIPDNWLWDEIYNLPLDEMIEVIDYALENGYTVAWGTDVSDKGFASKTNGIAIIPEADITEMSGSEISRWESLSETERQAELYKFEKPGKEKTITQTMRQIDFDNYTTTDDHGMHIIGTAKDQYGTVYYKVKNSWGDYNKYKGYFYASKPYVALRTIDIMIHKDALPKKISKKLNMK